MIKILKFFIFKRSVTITPIIIFKRSVTITLTYNKICYCFIFFFGKFNDM